MSYLVGKSFSSISKKSCKKKCKKFDKFQKRLVFFRVFLRFQLILHGKLLWHPLHSSTQLNWLPVLAERLRESKQVWSRRKVRPRRRRIRWKVKKRRGKQDTESLANIPHITLQLFSFRVNHPWKLSLVITCNFYKNDSEYSSVSKIKHFE